MKSKLSVAQIIIIVVAAVGSVFIAHYEDFLPYSWQTYVAPDGAFSLDLPGKPTVETKQALLEGGGTVPLHLITVSTDENTAYSCSYVEDENLSRKSPAEALESARDGSLRKTDGVLIAQNRIVVQGFPALDMQARTRGNTFLQSRIVVVGKRLYMIIGVAPNENSRFTKTLKRMLDSFKLGAK